MADDTKTLVFKVDAELCVGCGACVDSCPMKILALEDGLCVITDISKCLECGTCIRDCPTDAIFIPGVKLSKEKGAATKAPKVETRKEGQQFTPILQHLTELTQVLSPVQVFEYNGMDISSLNNFDLEGQPCFYRAYAADKLEKIGITRMNFYGTMVADVLITTPAPDYDIPYYVMDWDESDEHIFFICDLLPSDDLGRNMEHLQKYYYDELEDLYQTYSVVPGMKPSVFHWVRAIHSPYIITGTVEKTGNNVDMIYQCAVDYFNIWLKIYKEAKPRDPASDAMKLIHERRKMMRMLYKENDPGVGALDKFLGEKMAEVALSIIEP